MDLAHVLRPLSDDCADSVQDDEEQEDEKCSSEIQIAQVRLLILCGALFLRVKHGNCLHKTWFFGNRNSSSVFSYPSSRIILLWCLSLVLCTDRALWLCTVHILSAYLVNAWPGNFSAAAVITDSLSSSFPASCSREGAPHSAPTTVPQIYIRIFPAIPIYYGRRTSLLGLVPFLFKYWRRMFLLGIILPNCCCWSK